MYVEWWQEEDEIDPKRNNGDTKRFAIVKAMWYNAHLQHIFCVRVVIMIACRMRSAKCVCICVCVPLPTMMITQENEPNILQFFLCFYLKENDILMTKKDHYQQRWHISLKTQTEITFIIFLLVLCLYHSICGYFGDFTQCK